MLFLAAIVAVGLIRLVTLGGMALTDNTEARYAEIGWEMFRSGDWITPRLYLNGSLVPFWGKPPLFFWLTAVAYHIFDASEFSARLPNFAIGGVLVGLTVLFGRKLWGPWVGALAGLILASSGSFYILSGACVLDMALAATVTFALMSFALFARDDGHQAWWGRAFFFSIALGCLAKGPVAVVLIVLSIGLWLVIARQWSLLRRLPWISGLIGCALITCPWYLLAERATPGFLRYFLINEHLLRYIKNDYGDLYGNGRTQPYGASWFFLFMTFLPWSGVLIRFAFNRWRHRRAAAGPLDTWLIFALCWGLTPALFFTAARQILFTYLLPGFPGLALATAVVLVRWMESEQRQSMLMGLRVMSASLAILLAVGFAMEIVFRSSAATLALTLLAVSVFGALLFYGQRHRHFGSLLSAIGLGVPLIISVFLAAIGPRIDESFSTKAILTAISQVVPASEQVLNFPFSDSYSADFYEATVLRGRIDHHARQGIEYFQTEIRAEARKIFVIDTRNWQQLDPPIRDEVVPLIETPHWIACRIKIPRLTVAAAAPTR